MIQSFLEISFALIFYPILALLLLYGGLKLFAILVTIL